MLDCLLSWARQSQHHSIVCSFFGRMFHYAILVRHINNPGTQRLNAYSWDQRKNEQQQQQQPNNREMCERMCARERAFFFFNWLDFETFLIEKRTSALNGNVTQHRMNPAANNIGLCTFQPMKYIIFRFRCVLLLLLGSRLGHSAPMCINGYLFVLNWHLSISHKSFVDL